MIGSGSSIYGPARVGALVLVIAALALGASAPRATAFNPLKGACGIAGLLSKLAGKACDVLQGGRLVQAGRKLLDGKVGDAAKTLVGGGAARVTGAALGLAAVGAWVLGGAKAALQETEKEIGKTTSPRLQSTWFSSTYWRVAGLAALLTLPFLFAAALQALIRSDLGLLARAAFGYLPLALLAVSIAAPLTMLLLAASDEMCAFVSSASGGAGVDFLRTVGGIAGGLSVLDGSPFLAFLIGALMAGAALAVTLELLVREAAVYVVVLMLPLAFAGLVWPARRVWALRAIETLVALILAKFAIVAVLALAGRALGSGGASGMFAGTALVMLAAFSPWVLFRLLPFAELAGGAAGALRGEAGRFAAHQRAADAVTGVVEQWASSVTSGMQDDAERSGAAARLDGEARRPEGAAGSVVGAAGARRLNGAKVLPLGADADGDGDVPGPNGGSGGGSADAGGSEAPPAPRIPGMDPMWQADDHTWRSLTIGRDGRPTTPLWPPDQDGNASDSVGDPRSGDDLRPAGAGDDDPDGPLPPAQDPEGGRL